MVSIKKTSWVFLECKLALNSPSQLWYCNQWGPNIQVQRCSRDLKLSFLVRSFKKLEKRSAFLWCEVDYAEDTHVLICIKYVPTQYCTNLYSCHPGRFTSGSINKIQLLFSFGEWARQPESDLHALTRQWFGRRWNCCDRFALATILQTLGSSTAVTPNMAFMHSTSDIFLGPSSGQGTQYERLIVLVILTSTFLQEITAGFWYDFKCLTTPNAFE